jgi:hypothetical protein
MSVEHDSDAHRDATTILVRPDGRAIPHDDLDTLVDEIKSDMVSVGTTEYDDHMIVSEEREVSIAEIQEQFVPK